MLRHRAKDAGRWQYAPPQYCVLSQTGNTRQGVLPAAARLSGAHTQGATATEEHADQRLCQHAVPDRTKVNRHPAAKTRTQSSSNSTRCLANPLSATLSGISSQKRVRRLADYVYAQHLPPRAACLNAHCLRDAACNSHCAQRDRSLGRSSLPAPALWPSPVLRLFELLCQTAPLLSSMHTARKTRASAPGATPDSTLHGRTTATW